MFPSGHALQHGLVGEAAVLDAVAAGLDGVLDAAAGMGVGGDMLVVVVAISTAALNSSSRYWMARASHAPTTAWRRSPSP